MLINKLLGSVAGAQERNEQLTITIIKVSWGRKWNHEEKWGKRHPFSSAQRHCSIGRGTEVNGGCSAGAEGAGFSASRPAGLWRCLPCLLSIFHRVPSTTAFSSPGNQLLRCKNSHKEREKGWELLRHLKHAEIQLLHYCIHSPSTANRSISALKDNCRFLNPPKNKTLFRFC